MKEFFNSLDARMLSFVKGLRTKADAPVDLQGLDPDDIGSPIFLMVGSLSGCTAKDAESYARGLAETYVVSPHLGRVNVYDDKDNGRYVYEIHEGGPERSVIVKTLAELKEGRKVRVRLTNGATAVIEEANNEVFSLVFPAEGDGVSGKMPGLENLDDEDLTVHPVEDYCDETQLKELFPQNRHLVNIGGVILGVGISLFLLSGGVYTVVASEVLNGDMLFRQTKAGILSEANDNPVWQLEKARMAAEKGGQSVRALKKGPSGWSWELSAPAKPEGSTGDAAAASVQPPPPPPAPAAQAAPKKD